jgi:uncharacterized repeat protein (TIGR03899 family)
MTETNFSLIDLKALSEPASKLIEAVKDAIGIVYEPTHVRRMAQAEVDVEIIKVRGDLKSQELAKRASQRIAKRELQRQANVESIVRGALDSLSPSVSDDKVDDDWITHFFEQCQDVGSFEMQSLWAKLLAGEIAQPGTYSRRTLNLVRLMSKDDAGLFTLFCSHVFHGDEFFLHIRGTQSNALLRTKGLSYKSLLNLQNVGLIESGEVELSVTRQNEINLSYFDEKFRLILSSVSITAMQSSVNVTVLSKTGQELAPICGAVPDKQYITTVNEDLYKLDLHIRRH